MDLYTNGLIPKNTQDVDLALTEYANGRTDLIVVISRLKTLWIMKSFTGINLWKEKKPLRDLGDNGRFGLSAGR